MDENARRPSRGTMLGVVVASTICLLAVGMFLLALITLFGGTRELQNSVDAGALSVARRCLTEMNVKPSDLAAGFFDDVADPQSQINLENYNYAMAKVMLVQINLAAMHTLSEATKLARQNAA